MLPNDPDFITFGPFHLDRLGRRLTRGDVQISLGGRAFDALYMLAAAGGKVVEKEVLIRQIWPSHTIDDNNLQVQISSLRKVLGDGVIATVTGRGYRLAMTPQNQTQQAWDPSSGKPSLAVLPFTNMSGQADQVYFADGIANDIITELSRAQSFFVIARTSSFLYRDGAADLRQVAQELGVRYVLTGAVQRDLDRVRVTAEFTDAGTANTALAVFSFP